MGLRSRPERRVVLLRSHGLLAVGRSLEEAFEFAYDAEVGAQIYYQALQVGEPLVLDTAQVAEIHAVYGG
jgi:ribulose-5-phosphate 4-epimerase/fuculose-1-phosphate aldolase